MTTFVARHVVFGFLSLYSLAGWARPEVQEQEVRELGEADGVIARVLASFRAHMEPIGRWYAAAAQGRTVPERRFSQFSRPLRTGTFVSFTYTFTRDGVRHARTYHGRSGFNDLQTRIDDPADLRPLSAFYSTTGTDAVAWQVDPLPDSGVTHSPVDGDRDPDGRQRDAELKVARLIENDIRDGVVARGGSLTGFSSQAPCPSCRRALERLSEEQGIPITVSYLGNQSHAYRVFDGLRESYLQGLQGFANRGHLESIDLESSLSERLVPGLADTYCTEHLECDDEDGSDEAGIEVVPVSSGQSGPPAM